MDTFIYIISRNGSAPCKIGISDNPAKRLRSIKTACPFPCVISQQFPFPDRSIAVHIERCFHECLSKYREWGEWYALSPEDATKLLIIAIKANIEAHIKDPAMVKEIYEFLNIEGEENEPAVS